MRLLWALLFIALLIGGFISQKSGFQKVRDMRQLERIPETNVISVIPGEVGIKGFASDSKFTETVENGLMLKDHTVIKNVFIVIIRKKNAKLIRMGMNNGEQ